jgi:hypothetical protein
VSKILYLWWKISKKANMRDTLKIESDRGSVDWSFLMEAPMRASGKMIKWKGMDSYSTRMAQLPTKDSGRIASSTGKARPTTIVPSTVKTARIFKSTTEILAISMIFGYHTKVTSRKIADAGKAR